MPRPLVYAIAIMFAVYFPATLWLQAAYVDPAPKGKIVIQLLPPFERHGIVAVSRGPTVLKIAAIGDHEDVENDDRSPVEIYENQTRLGPAHSTFADIRDLGMGRFAHWQRQGLVFSASDNSDPNSNGRRYWAVVPLPRAPQVSQVP